MISIHSVAIGSLAFLWVIQSFFVDSMDSRAIVIFVWMIQSV